MAVVVGSSLRIATRSPGRHSARDTAFIGEFHMSDPASGRQRRHVEKHLGTTQLIIMEAIMTLGPHEAYGLAILDYINDRLPNDYPVDQAQVYVTLKRLLTRGYIAFAEPPRRQNNSPPLKLYLVTEAGERARSSSETRSQALLRAIQAPRVARSGLATMADD